MKLSFSRIVQLGEGEDHMETNKILAALSYFSIFFAGILFPLIVWIVSGDKFTKGHAKKAFLSHLAILIPVPFIVFTAIFEIAGGQTDIPVMFFISIFAMALVSIIVTIWNIVKGIQVLSKETY